MDGFELGEILRAGEDDVAEGGGGENEEEREAEAVRFGFTPFAKTLVECLLLGVRESAGSVVEARWRVKVSVGLVDVAIAEKCEDFSISLRSGRDDHSLVGT